MNEKDKDDKDDEKFDLSKGFLENLKKSTLNGSSEALDIVSNYLSNESIQDPATIALRKAAEESVRILALLQWGIQHNGIEKTLEDVHDILPNLEHTNFNEINSGIYDTAMLLAKAFVKNMERGI